MQGLCRPGEVRSRGVREGGAAADSVSVSPRSQAARGKEKEKDGTTDSGIKLEPVPGLPGGECRLGGCLAAHQLQVLRVP